MKKAFLALILALSFSNAQCMSNSNRNKAIRDKYHDSSSSDSDSDTNPLKDLKYLFDEGSNSDDETTAEPKKRFKKRLTAPRHWMMEKLNGIYLPKPQDQIIQKIPLDKNKKFVAWLYTTGKIEVYRKIHHPNKKPKATNNQNKILMFQTTLNNIIHAKMFNVQTRSITS